MNQYIPSTRPASGNFASRYALSIAVVAFMSMIFLVSNFVIGGNDAERKAIHGIPPYLSLQSISGTLEAPLTIVGWHAASTFGMIKEDDGQIFIFSCKPLSSDVSCLYPNKGEIGPHLGERVTIKYMTMSNWKYPMLGRYGEVSSPVPAEDFQRDAVIIMEARDAELADSPILLSYGQSTNRLLPFIANK